jgi:tetratricopeptide (TPR) repeat protein
MFAGVLTLFAQQGAIIEEDYLPTGARVANAVVAYVSYIGKMLWPSGLAVFYPHPLDGLPIWQVAGAALALVLITALAFWQARRRPYFIVGWLWFLGTLVPVIGLIQAGNQAMADRFTYVPLIGLFMGLTWGILDLATGVNRPASWPAKLGLAIPGCFVLFLLTACSWVQVGYWRDSVTLWEHTLQVTEKNAVAHNNLGVALWKSEKYQEALGHFEEAFRIQPKYGNAKHNLEVAHFELGIMLRGQGKWQEAEDHFYQATLINPDNDAAFEQRGIVFGFLDKWQDALESFKHAVNLMPGLAQYRADLALSFEERGQSEAAQLQYREALRLDPAWPERARQVAWTLATHPDPARRDGGRALQLARQICQAIPIPSAEVFDALAAAYAESGQYAEAVGAAQAAFNLASHAQRQSLDMAQGTELADQVRARLRLYEKGRPYREKESAPEPNAAEVD